MSDTNTTDPDTKTLVVGPWADADIGGDRRATACRDQNGCQDRDQNPVQSKTDRRQKFIDQQGLRVKSERQKTEGKIGSRETDDQAGKDQIDPCGNTPFQPQVMGEETQSPAGAWKEGQQVIGQT